jgi:peptidyl-tRNA hydrolase, PTH1 family
LRDPQFFSDIKINLFTPPANVYMNECGPVIANVANKKGYSAEELLVICDDFMLPLGQLRFRHRGSSGGHNGLDSVLDAFGTKNVPRLRVGIGPVPTDVDPADFVLERFKPNEQIRVTTMVARAASAAIRSVNVGLETAMNEFNPKESPSALPSPEEGEGEMNEGSK